MVHLLSGSRRQRVDAGDRGDPDTEAGEEAWGLALAPNGELAYDVALDSFGNIILTGSTGNGGFIEYDLLVIKLAPP